MYNARSFCKPVFTFDCFDMYFEKWNMQKALVFWYCATKVLSRKRLPVRAHSMGREIGQIPSWENGVRFELEDILAMSLSLRLPALSAM
jgi:hypothetical protein